MRWGFSSIQYNNWIVYKNRNEERETASSFKNSIHILSYRCNIQYYIFNTEIFKVQFLQFLIIKNTYPIITFCLISTSVPFTIDSWFLSVSFSGPSPERPSNVRTRFDFTSRIVSVYPTSCRYLYEQLHCSYSGAINVLNIWYNLPRTDQQFK